MNKQLTSKDFIRMNENMVLDVIEVLKDQLGTVNPPKFYNCVSYVIWRIKDQNHTIQVLKEEIEEYKEKINDLNK